MPDNPADVTDREAAMPWDDGGSNALHQMKEGDRLIGVNAMRAFLALGLLISLSASASAATMHHHFEPRHIMVPPGPFYAVPGWAYEAPRPPVHYYDDTPSYNDPSKFGGGTAL
ncbi:hypothetical protein AAFX91_04300 [Bradyrhizobium sp. 31Argb]|uniref:hypothetical protein n=1 Tax=unclassified Bradyrhizobium TaxID=2631580 RepID=UPI00102E7DA4|nr:hypothetical protein [Bradyrhizobium sp. Leo170]